MLKGEIAYESEHVAYAYLAGAITALPQQIVQTINTF